MNFTKMIDAISSKDDFIAFVEKLSVDKNNNGVNWENKDIESYLTAIGSWVEDMAGYYKNMHKDIPTNIDWKFIATLLYVGKIYE